MSDTKGIREEITRNERELARNRQRLAEAESRCRHSWTAPKYDPIVREGYQDPGDPEGTMGIDRRLPMYVPREETPRWTRTCEGCGKVETTSRTTDRVEKLPVF